MNMHQPDFFTEYGGDATAFVIEPQEVEHTHKSPTQAALILGYLQCGKRLTPMLALRLFGCNRLAARIAELKAEGWDICREMVDVGSGKRVAEYRLEHGQVQP